MLRRAVGPERGYLDSPEMVQLVLKTVDARYTPSVLAGVVHSAIGLRLRTDGTHLIRHNDPFSIVPLPSSICDTASAADFMTRHHTPDFSKVLAAVGCNDRVVALNTLHCCADGGFFHYVYGRLMDPMFLSERAPDLPEAMTDVFAREYSEVSAATPFTPASELTRLRWRRKRSPQDQNARYIEWSVPISKLRCWDGVKCVGMTEALWASLGISLAAYNAAFPPKFCLMTCVDLRPLIPRPSLGNCLNLVTVYVMTGEVQLETTVKEVGRMMRSDLEHKRKNGGLFATLNRERPAREGTSFGCVSSLGQFVMRHPIEDVRMTQVMPSSDAERCVCLVSWSKVAGERNDFFGRLRYSANVITDREAIGIKKSIRHVLENITGNTPAIDAFNQCVRVQRAAVDG
jgi:hypothetical protein